MNENTVFESLVNSDRYQTLDQLIPQAFKFESLVNSDRYQTT